VILRTLARDPGDRVCLAPVERFSSFDGVELAYLEAGAGPTVLLLHGFAADHVANWVQPGVFDALVEAGRHVVAFDARGHGASDKPHDPAAYANDAMARDVPAFLDHLGVDALDVVGYSMGAMTASRVVPKEPRARSLVLGGVGGRLVDGRLAVSRAAIADALVAGDARSVENVGARAFRRFADRTGADREALAAIQRAPRVEGRPPLAEITVPTLVLVGDGDTIASHPERLADAIPNATARVVQGDHLNAVYDPAFTTAIVEFLGAVRPG
jgi:pimeloyl-ACP methyl ester carboxylesterase